MNGSNPILSGDERAELVMALADLSLIANE